MGSLQEVENIHRKGSIMIMLPNMRIEKITKLIILFLCRLTLDLIIDKKPIFSPLQIGK
jgi:hypothetical protein